MAKSDSSPFSHFTQDENIYTRGDNQNEAQSQLTCKY